MILFTIPEAAKQTMMSEGFIKAAIRSGELRSGKFGRSRRILADDLKAWAVKIVVTTTDQGESRTDSPKNQVVEKTVGAR